MLATRWLQESEALAPHVRGTTYQVGGQPHGTIPGTTFVPWRQGAIAALDGIDSASADTLLALFELESVADPVDAFRQWARVVRPGGRVVVVVADEGIGEAAGTDWRHRFTPDYLTTIVQRVGGFQVVNAAPVVAGRSWILELERTTVAEIRMPFGSLVPEIGAKVAADPELRGELRFQTASVLLAAGDAVLAEPIFRGVLECESESPDALFGLGMCLGMQGRWSEALTELQRVVALDPANTEAQRWIVEARQRANAVVQPAAPVTPAAATPTATQPRPAAPTPLGT